MSALAEARRSAEQAFLRLGLPRTDSEAWRYTSLAPVAARLGESSRGAGVPADALDVGGPRLLFVDGALAEARHLEGVVLESIAARLAADPGALEAQLAGLAARFDDGLEALNVARFTDGAYVRVPRGVHAAAPITLTALSGGTTHLRHRIELDAGAKLELVEVLSGGPDAVIDAVTELVLGPGAELRYTRVHDGGAALLGRLIALHHEHSALHATSLLVSGELSRFELVATLSEHARAELAGASLVDGERVADQTTRVVHARGHGTSTQLFKAIAGERGVSTYYGKVEVAKGTQRNDARQSSKSLLLSPRASANTRPELQIDAQDVACSHGATVGRLDEAQVFYLRSRGVGDADARRMLTAAFAQEIVDRVSVPALALALGRRVAARVAELVERSRA